ncbi:PQQ-binding-like beta-propeller repeat protein [Rosistilla oblonga]|uniref:PQQ-binding-like beta-propeller repeat protein n=1 Tax=Rosistilla oblonga TaxID=2527990 RepID=UPI003A97D8A7
MCIQQSLSIDAASPRPPRGLKTWTSSAWLAIVLVLAFTPSLRAGDWPQILGPERNGIASDAGEGLWQQTPRVAWQIPCGSGYSGVAVVDGKVFLWHRVDDQERLDCCRLSDGQQLWQADFPATYGGGFNNDRGPRCVPVVDHGTVYVYGAAGDLHAVAASDGKPIWSRTLRQDYAAEDGYFGAGSTPIVSGDTVVVAVGGDEGHGIVGLDRKSGKTVWASTDLTADYASPIAFDATTVIVPMRFQTVVLNAADGEIVFEIPFGQRGLNVIGATPTRVGERLLLSASYRIGAELVDLSKRPPEIVWSGDDILSSQYNSGIVRDGYVYGIHGREDMGAATLRCIELATGKIQWSEEDYGVAHLIGVGDRLIAQRTDGTLELFAADRTKFQSLGKMELPPGTYRALPALSGGKLICRMSDGEQSKLLAVDLTAAGADQK